MATTHKPQTILFDASPLIHAGRSGVGYYTERLVTALATHNPDLTLTGYYFNFLGRKNIPHPRIAANVSFKPIRFFPGIILSPMGRILGWQLPLETFVWRRYSYHLFPNFIGLPSLRRTPSAIVVHDLGFIDHPQYVHDKNITFFHKLLAKSIHRSRVVFSVSEFTKSRLLKHFVIEPQKFVVTHNPPLTATPTPTTDLPARLTSLGITPKQYILFLGTIEPRKNLINLVEAYGQLPAAVRTKYSLVLAGGKGWKDESTLQAIKQAQQKGLDIIQTGYVSDTERAALYQHARLLALVSHYEGYGMQIMEAFSYNLPVLLSDLPVFHEVADEAATYCNPRDPKDIATQLTQLLTTPAQLKKQASAGKQRLAHFSWANTAKVVSKALDQ